MALYNLPTPGTDGRRTLGLAGIWAEQLRLYGVRDEDVDYSAVRPVQAPSAPFREPEPARSQPVRLSRLVWAGDAAFQIID